MLRLNKYLLALAVILFAFVSVASAATISIYGAPSEDPTTCRFVFASINAVGNIEIRCKYGPLSRATVTLGGATGSSCVYEAIALNMTGDLSAACAPPPPPPVCPAPAASPDPDPSPAPPAPIRKVVPPGQAKDKRIPVWTNE